MRASRANLEDRYRRARARLRPSAQDSEARPVEAEGGCGVTGFACTVPVGGKHIYEPSIQMRNRGNGKGGGVAACGLVAEDLGVPDRILRRDTILQVALLDPSARGDIEERFVEPVFEIDEGGLVPTVDDFREVPLLQVEPPKVARYFVRAKPSALDRFATEHGLSGWTERQIEDELIWQNSTRLNDAFYASLGERRAFVLSHARNLIILKIVGYAEAAVEYYRMGNVRAHVWIAHQRYPTKGRVWHPGGAHPFIGLNEALVHNGDFANYHAVTEYLAQRNVFPRFLTDTEVSAQLFDLMNRVYAYPLEYVIEALAPTTELDFDRLPEHKRRIYRQIQAVHLHAAPDGPWFFIIARSLADTGEFQLLGITDTAMLRPQVFAIQKGEVTIGLVCSEKQAIDATLASLAREDSRFLPVADRYWNARGGSHTDGGAFVMTVSPTPGSRPEERAYALSITNKFGEPIELAEGQEQADLSRPPRAAKGIDHELDRIEQAGAADPDAWFEVLRSATLEPGYDRMRCLVSELSHRLAESAPMAGIQALTRALDRCGRAPDKRHGSIVTILRAGLETIFERQPLCTKASGTGPCLRVTWDVRHELPAPRGQECLLLIDGRGFSPEGPNCDATLAVRAYALGWRRLVHYNCRGTRFHAAGLGPNTQGLRIDCYDNPGDYLGSGVDGLEVHVHGNAQDQVCQIAKRGTLVVHGDVGQTFMYGAKGAEAFVLGNAAGRPLINAVGRPRVVINGTALDFLAESFMAGDPHRGGGFVILNGLRFEDDGRLAVLDLPYPGNNLLSLASGGAIYIRDPRRTLVDEQLNRGAYRRLTGPDWDLIVPYLRENERHFGIRVEADLLTVDGVLRGPDEVYRKVVPESAASLDEAEDAARPTGEPRSDQPTLA